MRCSRPARSVGVARGDVPRDFRTLVEIAADGEVRGRRAGPIGLLESAITAIEAADQPLASVAARRLGIDQRLHLVAPGLAFVGAAYRAQIVQRAENFGEPLHVGLVRRARALSRTGREARAERDEDGGEE